MVNFKIKQINKKFQLPEGRHEITYSQWTKCYEQLPLIEKANDLMNAGKVEEAEKLAIEYSAKIISYLSECEYEDLLSVHPNQLANLFNIFLTWLEDTNTERNKKILDEQVKLGLISQEKADKKLEKIEKALQLPKRFKVKNRYFEVPHFNKATAGEYMDVMSLLGQIKSDDNIERGLVIASIYCREKDKGYAQNLEEIEERKEFFKKYAKIDLFHSCAFFLRSSLRIVGRYTLQHSDQQEVEKLTSTLNVWDTIHCLLLSQKQAF